MMLYRKNYNNYKKNINKKYYNYKKNINKKYYNNKLYSFKHLVKKPNIVKNYYNNFLYTLNFNTLIFGCKFYYKFLIKLNNYYNRLFKRKRLMLFRLINNINSNINYNYLYNKLIYYKLLLYYLKLYKKKIIKDKYKYFKQILLKLIKDLKSCFKFKNYKILLYLYKYNNKNLIIYKKNNIIKNNSKFKYNRKYLLLFLFLDYIHIYLYFLLIWWLSKLFKKRKFVSYKNLIIKNNYYNINYKYYDNYYINGSVLTEIFQVYEMLNLQ